MSISAEDSNIKVWNINNFKCILDFSYIYINENFIYSACFLNDNNNIFIITNAYSSNLKHLKVKVFDLNCVKVKSINESNEIKVVKVKSINESNEIKVFDLNGFKVKNINESKYSSYFIDVYYDKQMSKNFIILGNVIQVISYDFNQNKKYNQYFEKVDRFSYDFKNQFHYCVYIYNKDNQVNLIESSCKSKIKIWDFHTAKLLYTISIGNFSGLFLLNDDYLYIGYNYGVIKIKKLKSGINVKSVKSHKDKVLTLKKIDHPIYGECIISQSNSEIKLWALYNNLPDNPSLIK